MRILLTRAAADAARSAARLAESGYTAILSPVIEIAATSAPISDGNLDAVIATSAHAFAGTDVRALAQLPLYVVGTRTREAAAHAGWDAAITVAGTAHALIGVLRTKPALKRVLYLAGRERKPDIEAAGQEIGLDLRVLEAYAAHEASALTDEARRALRDCELDAVLHYSRRSAELFIAMVRRAGLWEEATKLRHYALSADVAEPLVFAGARTCVAEEPDEAHLLALLPNAGPR